MKHKKYRYPLLLSGIYMLICVALLISMTLSRYSGKRIAYTSFGAADFNAAVLDATQGMDSKTLITTLSTERFMPGMKWDAAPENDTSTRIDFRVTNGTTLQDVAEVSMNYTIRVRTAQSLPLAYTLAVQLPGENNTMVTTYYKTAGAPTQIRSTTGETRYEYMFSPVAYASPDAQTGTQPTDALEEPAFRLQQDAQNIQLLSNQHRLIIEWPADSAQATNSADYMKEVEVIELLVTATSLNQLEDADYYNTPVQSPTQYTGGIMLLIPPQPAEGGAHPAEYSETYQAKIDLRAFRQMAEMSGQPWQYDFTVDNAIGFQVTQDRNEISYLPELKVPVELLSASLLGDLTGLTEAELALLNGSVTGFRLFRSEDPLLAQQNLLGTAPVYRLYNEKNDEPITTLRQTDAETTQLVAAEYSTYAAAVAARAKQLEPEVIGIYAIYKIAANTDAPVLKNTRTNTAGGLEAAVDTHSYTLELTTSDGAAIPEQTSYEHKLELQLTATFQGGAPMIDDEPAGDGDPENSESTETPEPPAE